MIDKIKQLFSKKTKMPDYVLVVHTNKIDKIKQSEMEFTQTIVGKTRTYYTLEAKSQNINIDYTTAVSLPPNFLFLDFKVKHDFFDKI